MRAAMPIFAPSMDGFAFGIVPTALDVVFGCLAATALLGAAALSCFFGHFTDHFIFYFLLNYAIIVQFRY